MSDALNKAIEMIRSTIGGSTPQTSENFGRDLYLLYDAVESVPHGGEYAEVYAYLIRHMQDHPAWVDYIPETYIRGIGVSEITLTRVEGASHECYSLTLRTFAEAEAILDVWAKTVTGVYDKCDFSVVWKDGHEYKGRYDIGSDTGGLHVAIRQECKFYTGTYRPPHMTREGYAEYIRQYVSDEDREAFSDLLANYLLE